MTKQEFLDNLRVALSSRVGASLVSENVRFYEDYINTQIRMGKREEEVLKELGDPRLLARSIAEANKHAETGQPEESYSYTDNGTYKGTEGSYRSNAKTFHMPVWLIVLLVILVIGLILSVVFSVLSFLAPILIPVLLVVLLCRWLGGSKRL